jgi:hypothetical protein
MMDNITRVTSHIRHKLQQAGCKDIQRLALTVVPAKDGLPYYVDGNGHFWRMYVYIENAITVEVPQDCSQIYQAAKAFGQFIRQLVDLPVPRLHQTIPLFHDGPTRLRQLKDALSADRLNRAMAAKEEIEFILEHQAILLWPADLLQKGILQTQITHNDTKINNVLLDATSGQGLCVIDLDTVMDGLWIYDLGDILRTTCTTACEDEQDLTKVKVDLERYRAAVEGFLKGADGMIDCRQYQYIPLSGRFMALIMATRFLTDFLAGDMYFKVSRPNHNLDRCRCQCRLVQSMLQHAGQIEGIVDGLGY